MSDTFTSIIPADPLAVPSEAQRNAALRVFQELRPQVENFEIDVHETPVIHLAVQNLESVTCPLCEADLEGWWGDAMAAWWERDHTDLAATTPCCNQTVSLNDLDYYFDQGFACVAITGQNIDSDLTDDECARLEAALGCPIRIVRARI